MEYYLGENEVFTCILFFISRGEYYYIHFIQLIIKCGKDNQKESMSHRYQQIEQTVEEFISYLELCTLCTSI